MANDSTQRELENLQLRLKDSPPERRVSLLNLLASGTLDSDIQRSRTYADSAYKLALSLRDTASIAAALHNLGETFVAEQRYDSSLYYLNQAYDVLVHRRSDSIFGESCMKLANSHFFLNEHHNALGYFRRAAQVFELNQHWTLQAQALMMIGATFHTLSDYPASLDYFLKALESNPPGNHPLKADILNYIGVVYFDLGNFESALNYYLQSLEIVQRSGNQSGIANALNNIGIVYYEWENLEKALEYYQKSLQLEEDLQNELGVADSYNNIGIVYSDWDQNELAIHFYEKALQIYELYDQWDGLANTKNNIGESLATMKDYNEALKYLGESMRLELAHGKGSGLAQSYHAIAEVYLKMGELTKALLYNEKSYSIADSAGLVNIRKDNAKLFYTLYEQMGDPARSLYFFKLFKTLEDSIYSSKFLRKLADLQVQYELERREQSRILEEKEYLRKEANARFQRNCLILILALIIGFTVWVVTDLNRKSKTKKSLNLLLRKAGTQDSDLQRLKTDLRELRSRYEALMQNAPVGSAVLDMEGNILDANPQMIRLLDLQGIEDIRKINWMKHPPLKSCELSSFIADSFNNGSKDTHRVYYKLKDGQSLRLRCTTAPVPGTGKHPGLLMLFVEDLTAGQKELRKSE